MNPQIFISKSTLHPSNYRTDQCYAKLLHYTVLFHNQVQGGYYNNLILQALDLPSRVSVEQAAWTTWFALLLDLAKGRYPDSTNVLLSNVTNDPKIKQNNLMDVMKELENIPLDITISLRMCLDALIRSKRKTAHIYM